LWGNRRTWASGGGIHLDCLTYRAIVNTCQRRR
jgi:hypothetical protein